MKHGVGDPAGRMAQERLQTRRTAASSAVRTWQRHCVSGGQTICFGVQLNGQRTQTAGDPARSRRYWTSKRITVSQEMNRFTVPRSKPTIEDAYGIAPTPFRLPGTSHVGGVRLQVSDIARSITYYEQIIGLTLHSATDDTAVLGSQDGQLRTSIACS